MKLNYNKIVDFITQKNRQNFFIIIGVAGMLLIASSDFEFAPDKKNTVSHYSLNEYKVQLESEVTELLREIEGVGNVKVMITLESGEENIYVKEEKSENDNRITKNGTDMQEDSQTTYENEIVIVSAQNTNQPVIEKTLQPTVQGVAVVCSGADDIIVISAVTNTVSVVLNIPTSRICVTKMR